MSWIELLQEHRATTKRNAPKGDGWKNVNEVAEEWDMSSSQTRVILFSLLKDGKVEMEKVNQKVWWRIPGGKRKTKSVSGKGTR